MTAARQPAGGTAAVPAGVDPETYQTLLAKAQRQTGRLPPDLVVCHVLSVTTGGDWPVQRDALDAVLRRVESARTDEIRIVGRPPRGRILGLYETRRRAGVDRPYRTLLRSIDPIDGSCDCADFLRNAPGLCKHLVAVIDRALSKRTTINGAVGTLPAAALRWDPVRPLTGGGDWLARVRAVDEAGDPTLRRWLGPRRGDGRVVALPETPQSGWRSSTVCPRWQDITRAIPRSVRCCGMTAGGWRVRSKARGRCHRCGRRSAG